MIRNFLCPETERLCRRERARKLPDGIQRVALRKGVHLHAAVRLDDLRVPPGNRLESLRGDREGQHAIRVNDPWRVGFVWLDGAAYDVEIVDDH